MKLNKKQAGLLAGVACVILLIILLLTMCRGGGQNETDLSAGESSVAETQSVAEITETTENAEATEETTEATEEADEDTAADGSATPGGISGPSIGGTDSDQTKEETTPSPGSASSPYFENIVSFPDSVTTVSIPAEGTVHYNLSLNDESVATYGESLLVIAAEDAYVVYNETKYEAKDGVISVPLAASYEESEEEEETGEAEQAKERLPVSLQICNIGTEAKTFLLSLDAPLGTADNPEELIRDERGAISFTAALEAEDEDGYYFDLEAERDGVLNLQLDSITENTECDIVVTAGKESVTLSSDAEELSVAMEFKKGDMVTVQVLAKKNEEGILPAIEVELSGIADYYGSKTNPIVVKDDFTTEEMEPGMVLYYLVENQNGMALNVEEPAYVIYNDKTYQAPEDEDAEDSDETTDTEDSDETTDTEVEEEPYVISVKIGNSDDAALVAIGNGGEEPAEFGITFGYPAGHVENKAPMIVKNVDEAEDGTNTATVDPGDTDVYWYSWTNNVDTGILTIQMPQEGSWRYQIKHISENKTTIYDMQYSDSENVQRTVQLTLDYNDVIDIQVCTYDPADPAALPVGSVEFDASFLAHFQTNASGDSWLTLEGMEMVYCKQGLKYADGAIMTVVAVEANEEGDPITDADGNVTILTDRAFTIDYEGTVYTSENGTIVIEGIEMESADPDIFSVVNDTDKKTTYKISFSYPAGHQANPIAITDGKYSVELYGASGAGVFYSWTTTEPVKFAFVIDPSSVWTYNISSTKDSAVFSSTQNGATTTFVSYVELNIGQSHLNDSGNGSVTVTINLGNPSSKAEDKSVVSFEVGRYKTKVTMDASVAVAAGETHPLMQELEDMTADGMTITGEGSFTVVYDGKEYASENGVVQITNFSADITFFQIINHTDADQTYSIQFNYPIGTPKNPEILASNTTWDVDLSTITEYYYTWTAAADGTFTFELPLNGTTEDKYKPWAYEITHGEDIYKSQRGGKMIQSFAVQAGDVVSIKLGTSMEVSSSTSVRYSVSFEAAAVAMSLREAEIAYESEYVPKQFALSLTEEQTLVYTDLSKKNSLFLNEKDGCYYLSEDGPAVLVDFTSDAFVNLANLLKNNTLYCEITAEDGTVVQETYNALLEKYIACAAVIQVSETETKTLYPLTEDLMYILKNVGAQLGWYDRTAGGYLFGTVAEPEADSLWMFSCCTVQTSGTSSEE